MQKIVPCFWFDTEAIEAVNYYTSIFEKAKIERVTNYTDGDRMPKGSVMSVKFVLEGQEFIALNGGPLFNFTPAISFFINCGSLEEVDRLWSKLSENGKILMELGEYPFSRKYGWLEDKYGITWQLNLKPCKQKINPFFMFSGEQYGKGQEAMNFYISLFNHSDIITLEQYGENEEEPIGTFRNAKFSLSQQEFMVLDSNIEHPFTFSEAISFYVYCNSQKEIDVMWDKLSYGGEESMCGWLKDRFGVSWVIVPDFIDDMLMDNDPERLKRVMDTILKMRKIDIQTLQEAYNK